MSAQEVIFEGSDALKSDAFIRLVTRRAMEQNVINDDVATAHIAVACLGGVALHWYVDLDDDATQNSWKLLRRAILHRWPVDAPNTGPAAPLAPPTPPQAIRQRPHPVVTGPGAFPYQDVLVGRIRMYSPNGYFRGYVSRWAPGGGSHRLERDLSKAVVLRRSNSAEPQKLVVEASGPNSPEYCLGARILWKNTKTLLRAVLDDNTRPCSGGLVIIPKSEPFGDSTNRRQEERSGEKDYRAIWQITADGTLTAVCQELSGVLVPLTSFVSSDGAITMTTSPETFQQVNSDSQRVRMVFSSLP